MLRLRKRPSENRALGTYNELRELHGALDNRWYRCKQQTGTFVATFPSLHRPHLKLQGRARQKIVGYNARFQRIHVEAPGNVAGLGEWGVMSGQCYNKLSCCSNSGGPAAGGGHAAKLTLQGLLSCQVQPNTTPRATKHRDMEQSTSSAPLHQFTIILMQVGSREYLRAVRLQQREQQQTNG